MMKKLFSILSIIVAVSVLIAGCGEQITAEQVVAKLQKTIGDATDMHFVMTAELAETEGETASMQAEIWEQHPNKFRIEGTAATPEGTIDVTVVSDGTQTWTYEAGSDRVIVGEAQDLPLPLPPEAWQDIEELIQTVLDEHDAKLIGEEKVAGLDTYKLELTLQEGAGILPGNGVATIWIDKTAWIVCKVHYADTMGEITVDIQTAEFNQGVDDGLFTFTIPEGVEIIPMRDMMPEPLTLDEAREKAEFPLLVPTYVPDGATLIELFKVEGRIVMQYNLNGASWTILQEDAKHAPEFSFPPNATVEKLDLRGVGAQLSTNAEQGFNMLMWEENGVAITLYGALDRAEMLKIVEGLK